LAAAAPLTEAAGPAALAAAQHSLGSSVGSTFGLSWLDTATGGLVVGRTDAARSAQVRAAGATPEVCATARPS
jgi:streptogrisin C